VAEADLEDLLPYHSLPESEVKQLGGLLMMTRLWAIAATIVVALAMLGCAPSEDSATTIALDGSTAPYSAGTSGTGQATTTSVTEPGPSTTVGQGEMAWPRVLQEFERLVGKADLGDILPYSRLTGEELAGVLDEAESVGATAIAGYRFANGDLVILFHFEPLQREGAQSAAYEELHRIANERYSTNERKVDAEIAYYDYGFITSSIGQYSALGGPARMARQ
jgi:hypothetical protein